MPVRVLVLADDLIWSTRLLSQVRAAGADAAPVRTLAALEDAIPEADAVIVDLTARAYDGIVAIRKASAAGRRVLAVDVAGHLGDNLLVRCFCHLGSPLAG